MVCTIPVPAVPAAKKTKSISIASTSSRKVVISSNKQRIRKQVKAPIPLFPHKPQASPSPMSSQRKTVTQSMLIETALYNPQETPVQLRAEYYSRLKQREALKQLKNSFRYEQPASFALDQDSILAYVPWNLRVDIVKAEYAKQGNGFVSPWYSIGFAILAQQYMIQEKSEMPKKMCEVRASYSVEQCFLLDRDTPIQNFSEQEKDAKIKSTEIREDWYTGARISEEKRLKLKPAKIVKDDPDTDFPLCGPRASRHLRRYSARGHIRPLVPAKRVVVEHPPVDVSDSDSDSTPAFYQDEFRTGRRPQADPYLSCYPTLRPHTMAIKEIVREIVSGSGEFKEPRKDEARDHLSSTGQLLGRQKFRQRVRPALFARKLLGNLKRRAKICYRDVTLALKEQRVSFAMHTAARAIRLEEKDIIKAEETVQPKQRATDLEIAELAGKRVLKLESNIMDRMVGDPVMVLVSEEFRAEFNKLTDSFTDLTKSEGYNGFRTALGARNDTLNELAETKDRYKISPGNHTLVVNRERIGMPYIFEGSTTTTKRKITRRDLCPSYVDAIDEYDELSSEEFEEESEAASEGSIEIESDHAKMTSLLFSSESKEMAKLLVRKVHGNHKSIVSKIIARNEPEKEDDEGSGSDDEDVLKTGRSHAIELPLAAIPDIILNSREEEDDSDGTASKPSPVAIPGNNRRNFSPPKIVITEDNTPMAHTDSTSREPMFTLSPIHANSKEVARFPAATLDVPGRGFAEPEDALMFAPQAASSSNSLLTVPPMVISCDEPIPRAPSVRPSLQEVTGVTHITDGNTSKVGIPRIMITSSSNSSGDSHPIVRRTSQQVRRETDTNLAAAVGDNKEPSSGVPSANVTTVAKETLGVPGPKQRLTLKESSFTRMSIRGSKAKDLKQVKKVRRRVATQGKNIQIDMSKQLFDAVKRMSNTEVEGILTAYPSSKLNIRDSNGETMLHAAVKADSRAIVKMLIKAGADVNAQDVCSDDDNRLRIEVREHAGTLCEEPGQQRDSGPAAGRAGLGESNKPRWTEHVGGCVQHGPER